MNLTLKQLRYFEALTQHAHFGRAAEACAISQPALSVQIKELEANLGVVLFERSARHVQLTEFGHSFAARVREILRSIDELGDFARVAKDRMIGRLRLGVIPTVAPYLLPTIIRQLDETYPSLEVEVRETLTPKLVRELLDGQLDAAIVALPTNEPALMERLLFEERFVLIRHADQIEKPVPTPDQLCDMKLLLLEEGHCFRDQAVAFCASESGSLRDGLDGSSLSTLVQMVGAGIGVTLIPEIAIPVELRAAPVCAARFAGKEPGRKVGMVWRRTSPLAARLEEISDLLQQAAAQLHTQNAHIIKVNH